MSETLLKVPLDELDTSDYDLFLEVTYEGASFTGNGYEDTSHHYSEYRYVNGQGHGKCYSVYKSGQKMEEFELNEGKYINEEHQWYPSGQLRAYSRHTPIRITRKWNEDGILIWERDEESEVNREWYGTGELFSEHMKVAAECVYYDKSGAWIMKQRSRDGHLTFTIEDMMFNEELLLEHYAGLFHEKKLENHLFLWLRTKLSEEYYAAERILCDLITHPNLYVKDNAIFIAGERNIEAARPYLEEALDDYRIPPAEHDPIHGTGRSHSRRICDQAKIALGKMKRI